ncbi:Uncharacterised protein [Vibrio cholerae]|nr:Uncharacterised protein [Vibrio cholerae]
MYQHQGIVGLLPACGLNACGLQKVLHHIQSLLLHRIGEHGLIG